MINISSTPFTVNTVLLDYSERYGYELGVLLKDPRNELTPAAPKLDSYK